MLKKVKKKKLKRKLSKKSLKQEMISDCHFITKVRRERQGERDKNHRKNYY